MITYEDLLALAAVSRETYVSDTDSAHDVITDAGYDDEGVGRGAREFAHWHVQTSMRVAAFHREPLDLFVLVRDAWLQGMQLGIRAESLRRDREELPEL